LKITHLEDWKWLSACVGRLARLKLWLWPVR
jgi:hypothetical protein